MTEISFGHLDFVPTREGWRNEAADFTPWLAENLDRLGDVVGLELELLGTEQTVGRYSADIFAQDSAGTRVLIENQLERADHKHLGQIMTYLGGLDAKAAIWVASDFGDDHLSAIRWLNENTLPDRAFFAVRLRLARIGTSEMAPVFEILEKPNRWEKAQASAVSTSQEALNDLRSKFWARYLTRHPNAFKHTKWSNIWIPLLPQDRIVVCFYVSARTCGVYLRGPHGAYGAFPPEDLEKIMSDHGETLEAELGIPMNPSKGWFFQDTVPRSLSDEPAWDEIIDWMEERRERYSAAVTALPIGR